MAHQFQRSLRAGKAGEAAFLAFAAKHNILLEPTDGRAGDFKDADGHLWELKTDSYDMDKTTNFFIERYSNAAKGTVGGPWQAEEHGCKYFAYYFPANNTAFIFETLDLLGQLTLVPLGNPIDIRNVRHTTIGFKVPRSGLKPLYVLTKDGKHDCK